MAGPVDELVDDFLALRRDGRVPAWRSLEADHGALEFCGDEVHMTLTFVGSDGLTLLTAGTIEQTVTYFEEMQRSQGRGPRYGWVAKVQAARAVWGGETRGFRPLGSGRVVGVIERGKAALVLGIVDSNCVVVLVDERRRTLLGAWQCQHLGVVDVDTYLRLEAPRRSAVKRDPQDVSDRITLALRSLAARAKGPGSEQLRGKKTVGYFIEVLLALGQAGCGDLWGRACDIVDEIARHLPHEVLSARQVGRVLALLEGTATVLIERPTPRTWRIRLADLLSPSSAIHKAVCAESSRGRQAPISPPRTSTRPPTPGDMLHAGLDLHASTATGPTSVLAQRERDSSLD